MTEKGTLDQVGCIKLKIEELMDYLSAECEKTDDARVLEIFRNAHEALSGLHGVFAGYEDSTAAPEDQEIGYATDGAPD